MTFRSQSLGRRGEGLALAHLKQLGYRIININYRCRLGEIDIIADEAGTLAFIEVKCRSSRAFGEPYEAVTKTKMAQMSRVALEYLSRNQLHGRPARFDVVSIKLSRTGEPAIELIRNAFELQYGK